MIHFLYPSFLFALTAIAIPIIIHLFNFRRYKTVYFSNVQFLKNIKQKTQAQSRLRHLLVLLCRILTIACIVVAFAQPFIPLSKNITSSANKTVSVYIDNSFSMDAESKYGKLLEVAKNKAKDIADAYSSGTGFLLLTNDFDPKHQHLLNKEQFIDFVSKIDESPVTRNMSEVFMKQQDFLSSENKANLSGNEVYILSDFQRSSADLTNIKNDSSININLIPLATQPSNNLYIDSCWFETPGRKINQPEELYVKITNKSPENYQGIPVKLYINDSLKSLSSLTIKPNSSETLVMTFTNTQPGIEKGKVEISDYPITYDNAFFFCYTVYDKVPVLCINQDAENRYISALFRNDPYFMVSNCFEKNINYAELAGYNTIILSGLKSISSGLAQELVSYIGNGGALMLFPNIDSDMDSYNSFLAAVDANSFSSLDTARTVVKTVSSQNDIYKNVFKKIADNADFPAIFRHYTFNNSGLKNEEVLLAAKNSHAILKTLPFKKGKLFVFAIPLADEAGNFQKHALFVPTLYNIVLNSRPATRIYYIIGKDNEIDLFNKKINPDNVFHIVNSKNTIDFIPQMTVQNASIRLFMGGNIKTADNYIIRINENPVEGIAFNYNRDESDLSYYDKPEIEAFIKKSGFKNFSIIDNENPYLSKTLKEMNQGKQLWKWFVLLALLFIACEIALLRLLKR